MDNEKAIKLIQKHIYYTNLKPDVKAALELAIKSLENERLKAYWIERFEKEDKWLECSNCHLDSDEAYNFCPNCGTDMRGDLS